MRARAIVLLCFVLLVLLSPASAQDAPPYHLRELTASDYVNGVLDQVIANNYYLACPFDFNRACKFPKILALEPILRYDPLDVDYATLRKAYGKILPQVRWEDAAARYWTEQLILAWLREHVSAVGAMPNLAITGYEIGVTPFDADGDGQPEWLLKVNTGTRGLAGLLALSRNADGTFEFMPTPLPVARPCCFDNSDYDISNSVALIRAEDVNGDGQDEIVAFSGRYSSYDTNTSGRVYVLGWRDGTMVDLMTEPLNYIEPAYLTSRAPEPPYQTLGHSWQFSTDSGMPELIQTQRHEDNFGCVSYETSRYQWQAGSFALISAEPDWRYEADSMGCKLREAQEAFWAGDFQSALDLYNQMLAMPSLNSTVPNNLVQEYPLRRSYALVRSALAQALLGDMQVATTTLKSAQQETDDRQFADLISGLLAVNDLSFHLCQQAYLFFLQEYRQGTFWPPFVNALYEPPGGSYPPPAPSPDPAKAGCDPALFVENAARQWQWTENKTPDQQFASAGIQPGETLQTDLNGDGKLDWVVWMADGADALIFLSTQAVDYQVVRAAISAPTEQIMVSPLALPDEAGNALVVINSSSEFDPQMGWNNYYCPDFSGDGSLPIFQMWQFTGKDFERVLQAPLCDGVQQPQDLFPADGGLRVGALSAEGSYVTTSYTWDSEQQQFRPPEIATPTPIEPDPILSVSLNEDLWTMSGESFLSLMETYTPEIVLKRIDQWLRDNPGDQMALYERGVVLDLMGDKEGALAAFIQVHEQSKDTQLGILAGLHLES